MHNPFDLQLTSPMLLRFISVHTSLCIQAVVFLTTLPMGPLAHWAFAQQKQPEASASGYFPVVGLLLGGIISGVGIVLLINRVPIAFIAILLALLMTILTGALHEDGTADCADGFFGAHDRERKIAIMHDSTLGSFGVIALVFSILFRFVALSEVLEFGLLWPTVILAMLLSRTAMVWMMGLMKLANNKGLAANFGQPKGSVIIAATFAALVTTVVLMQGKYWAIVVILTIPLGVTFVLALLTYRHIKGYNGDVLGLVQQMSEISLLMLFPVLFLYEWL